MQVEGKKIYQYKTIKYFSGSSYLMAVPFFVCGVSLLNTIYFAFGILFLILAVGIPSTHYALEINVTNKTFRHYLWILGYRHGPVQTYELIEYAFIQSARVSRTLYSTASSSKFTSQVYNGYLKFSDGTKIHLMQARDKETIMQKLELIATDLKVEIVDFTDDYAVSIVPS